RAHRLPETADGPQASRDTSVLVGRRRQHLEALAVAMAREPLESFGRRLVIRKVDDDPQMGLALRDVHAVLEIEASELAMDDRADALRRPDLARVLPMLPEDRASL